MFEHEQVCVQSRMDRTRLLPAGRAATVADPVRSGQRNQGGLQYDQEGNTVW